MYISVKIQNQIEKSWDSSSEKKDLIKQNLLFPTSEWILKTHESMEFIFEWNNTGVIKILSGGPLEYKIFSWSTIIGSSYVTDKSWILSLKWKLQLQNLWAGTKVKLHLENNSWVILPYNYEKILIQIGENSFVQEILEK